MGAQETIVDWLPVAWYLDGARVTTGWSLLQPQHQPQLQESLGKGAGVGSDYSDHREMGATGK